MELPIGWWSNFLTVANLNGLEEALLPCSLQKIFGFLDHHFFEILPSNIYEESNLLTVRKYALRIVNRTSILFREIISPPELGEIIEISGGPRHLSTIPLKNFHLFKIAESVINFCLKKISN